MSLKLIVLCALFGYITTNTPGVSKGLKFKNVNHLSQKQAGTIVSKLADQAGQNEKGASFKIQLDKVACTHPQARSLLRNGAHSRKVRSQDGSKEAEVALKNNYNYDYIGKFYVGNPPQEMRGCFDTGSANAWILSSQCVNERCKKGTKNEFFNPFESNTFVNTSEWTSIQFGSGALRGYFGIDDFRVGHGSNEIHIKDQCQGLIVEEHVLDDDYDAIIGLAYPTMADTGLPIFDNMMQ